MKIRPKPNLRLAWLSAIFVFLCLLILAIHSTTLPASQPESTFVRPVPVIAEGQGSDKTQTAEPAPETAVSSASIPPEAASASLQVTSDPQSIRVPVLLYHYVRETVHSKDIARYELNVPPALFEAQLKTLADDGAHFVTLSQIADALDGKAPLPENPVAITFDDGLEDVYSAVFPILKKTQAKITAFLVTRYLGHGSYLKPDQIKEMVQSGLVEIASHSVSHPHLEKMTDDKARAEIVDSKSILEKGYGIEVSSLAYPFGLFNQNTPKLAQQAGYRIAVSMIYGMDISQANRFFVPRINIGQRIGKDLLKFLASFK